MSPGIFAVAPHRGPAHRAAASLMVLLGLLLTLCGSGCTRSTLAPDERPSAALVPGIGMGYFDERVHAFVVPPEGWALSREDSDHRHTQLVWLSPSGNTAYGVIYLRLPAYAFANQFVHNSVLNQFLREMEQQEGEATLLSRRWDGEQRQLWFTAEGGRYRLESVLRVRGRSGWVTYVGELRGGSQVVEELEVAARAREATLVAREAARGGRQP